MDKEKRTGSQPLSNNHRTFYLEHLIIFQTSRTAISPIARSAVRFTQRIRNQALRNRTLDLIEAATGGRPAVFHKGRT